MLNKIKERIIPGVLIVTVCKNYEKSLKEVFATWSQQENIDKIIVLLYSFKNNKIAIQKKQLTEIKALLVKSDKKIKLQKVPK